MGIFPSLVTSCNIIDWKMKVELLALFSSGVLKMFLTVPSTDLLKVASEDCINSLFSSNFL